MLPCDDENHSPIIFHTDFAFENVQVQLQRCEECGHVQYFDSIGQYPCVFNFNNRIFFTIELLQYVMSVRGLNCSSFDHILSAASYRYAAHGRFWAASRASQSTTHEALLLSFLTWRHIKDPHVQAHFSCDCQNGPESVLLDGVTAGLPTSRGTFTPPLCDADRQLPCVGPSRRNFLAHGKDNNQIRVRLSGVILILILRVALLLID